MTHTNERRIAQNATSGEWRCETYVSVDGRVHLVKADGCQHVLSSLNMSEEDAEFIEMFNPQRVLELLDQIEQLQAVVRDKHDECTYQARLAAVEKLHQPFEWSFGYGPLKSCAHCADLGASEDEAAWPCPTIKAVRGD